MRIDALERILLASLGMKTLIFGKAVGSAVFGAKMGVFVLLVSLVVFGLSVCGWMFLVVCLVLLAFSFALRELFISFDVR